MSRARLEEDWDFVRAYDFGMINKLNSSILKSRYNPRNNGFEEVRNLISRQYNFEILPEHHGPHLAVILRVLNTADSALDGETKSYTSFLSKSDEGEVREDLIFSELRRSEGSEGAKTNLTRIIAKVPDYDIDLPWPETGFDRKILNLHGEYWAQSTSNEFSNLKPGQVVLVVFNSTVNFSAATDGKYSGLIVGVPTARFMNSLAFAANNAASSFEPINCPSPRLLIGPSGKKVVVTTKNDFPLRITKKIKNKIKTGIFGDGTIQTKTHFANCLNTMTVSYKNAISAPAPGPSSAFLWVGHLRSNGPLDLLDRAMSKGRETIIYAPRHFDVNSPFEIKYYFHDFAGFGRAWIQGPSTTIEDAAKADRVLGGANDFIVKIAPAINDMIKDRRNFILVIPELMHSMGFGTGNSQFKRVQDISEGLENTSFSPEVPPTQRLRSSPSMSDPQMRSAVYGYLNTMSAKVGEKLSALTLLVGRAASSFTAGFTSGDFKNFHQDVLEVLEQYLGVDYSKLEYTHLVGDDAGALTIASMGSSVVSSQSHNSGQDSFNSMIASAKVKRIDFIDRGSGNQTLGVFKKLPPVQFYEDFLANLSTPLEFNYVTAFNADSAKSVGASRTFFDSIPEHKDEFNKFYNASSEGGLAFSLESGAQSTINLLIHQNSSPAATDAATGLCFSFKSDTDTAPTRPSQSYNTVQPSTIPNHAGALQRSSGEREVAERLEKIKTSNVIISYFEGALKSIAAAGNLTAFCADPNGNAQYQKYCSGGVVDLQQGGSFLRDYDDWLNNRELSLKESIFLVPFYTDLARINSIDDIDTDIEKFKGLLENAKTDLNSEPEFIYSGGALQSEFGDLDVSQVTRKNLRKLFKSFDQKYWNTLSKFNLMAGVDLADSSSSSNPDNILNLLDPSGGYVGEVLYANAKVEAYDEIIKALESKKTDLTERNDQQRVATSFDCKPNSKRISELGGRRPADEGPVSRSEAQPCSGLESGKIKDAFRTVVDVITFLPYTPSRSDFAPFQNIGNVRVSKNPTDISNKLNSAMALYGMPPVQFSGINIITKSRDNATKNVRSTSPNSVKVFGCLSSKIETAWLQATNRSKYTPFGVVRGLTGDLGVDGITSYHEGLSPFAYGLAITIDPFLCISVSAESMTHSIWTGAWTPKITRRTPVVKELLSFGVFSGTDYSMYQTTSRSNISQFGSSFNQMLLKDGSQYSPENIAQAFKLANDNSIGAYERFAQDAAGSQICAENANPTKWMIEFCERSGMRWYNSFFMKKRWSQAAKKWINIKAGSTNDFSSSQKNYLSQVYDVPNIVERVRNVSVDFQSPHHKIDKHAQFMFVDLKTPFLSFQQITRGKTKVEGILRNRTTGASSITA